MVAKGLAATLIKRTTYSTAINVLPGDMIAPNEKLTSNFIYPRRIDRSETSPRPYSAVPGPKELPLIGNSWRFAPFIGQYKIEELDRIMNELRRDYGKIAKVGGLIGHPDLLFIFDGDEIRNIFKKEEILPHRPSMPSLQHYKAHLHKDFFGDSAGVIGVHGERWDKFRAQVQQVMLQPSTARKYIGPLNEIATDFMKRVHTIRDENDELPDDFLNELYKWALESIGRVSLDTRLGCITGEADSQKIIEAINTFFSTIAIVELRMPVWRIYKTKTYKKYIAALDSFKDLCMKHIDLAMEMRKYNTEPKKEDDMSILDRILEKTGNPKIAAVLALDLFFVGVDTTSVATTSTIYQLSKNPTKQIKLLNELKKVLPNKDSPVDANALEHMPYLRACIRETLRMYPVVIGNGRCLQSDAVVAGYHVPKGTHVIFPHYNVSNDDEYFPEPYKFIPERWMKNNDTAETQQCPHAGQKIHPFVSLPFGYGRRTCLGKRFAETELLIILSKIFRKYHVEYNYGALTYKVNPTYIPEQPLKFKLSERED